jgi:hypothetical protein
MGGARAVVLGRVRLPRPGDPSPAPGHSLPSMMLFDAAQRRQRNADEGRGAYAATASRTARGARSS